jgi:zinc-binding in reverse transcriptase
MSIFLININKKIGNDKATLFWHDKWALKYSQKTYFSLLFELTTDQNITVDKVIRYNRYYLFFRRNLSPSLQIQLNELYSLLSTIRLNNMEDTLIWRWNLDGSFSTHSLYTWLDFGGVIQVQYAHTWESSIPFKIQIFLWLTQQNKILTKDNLLKRKWKGDPKCVFYDSLEIMDNLFLHCTVSSCLWSWICRYNNYYFTCNTLSDLWIIDANLPYKNNDICEIIRRAFLWTIWKERNKIVFEGAKCKSLRALGNSIITLAEYWCGKKR